MSTVVLGEEVARVKFACTSLVLLGLRPIVCNRDEQKLRSTLNRIQETRVDSVLIACSEEDKPKWEQFVEEHVYHRGYNFPVIWHVMKESVVR